MSIQDKGILQQAQLNELTRYNVETPALKKERFAECMATIDTELVKYIPCAKFIYVPLHAHFLGLTNPETLFFILKYEFNENPAYLKLQYLKQFCRHRDADKNFFFGKFEILNPRFFSNSIFELSEFYGANNENDLIYSSKMKDGLSDAFNPHQIKEDELNKFAETNLESGSSTTFLSETLSQEQFYVFGVQFVHQTLHEIPVDCDEMCLDFINGFQEFGRDIVSKAQLNPGPQVRAHLFAKRQRLEVDEMDPAQSFLDHEVRDHEHSGMWWVRKIAKLACIIGHKYSVTTEIKKHNYQFWDAAMNDPNPNSILTEIKIEQNENFSITISSLPENSSSEVILKACNGYYTSTVLANGNILNGGVTDTCLLNNNIKKLTNNLIAQCIPFAGMDDPGDKFALAIPFVVKVIAQNADDKFGPVPDTTATFMQISNFKKLTAYAKQLLATLAVNAQNIINTPDSHLEDNECRQIIASALTEMYKADKSTKVGTLQNTIDKIINRPQFACAVANPNFKEIITNDDNIELNKDKVRFWPLTMLLGLKDQAELHVLSQIERPEIIELHGTLTPNKSWLYGSCISDAFELSTLSSIFGDSGSVDSSAASKKPPASTQSYEFNGLDETVVNEIETKKIGYKFEGGSGSDGSG